MKTPELNNEQFNHLFPFHLIFDEDMIIRQTGRSLQKLLPQATGKSMLETFHILRPRISTITFEDLKNFEELVIAKTKTEKPILFRGEIEFLEKENQVLVIGTPWFRSMDELMQHNLSLHDFAISDPLIDLLHILKTEEIVSKEVKELLEKVNRQKKETEELAMRMQSLFEHATESILLTDKNGKILMANPAALSLFKYPKEEIEGMKVENLLPKKYSGIHEGHRDSFFHNPSSRMMGKGRELYAVDKNGMEFPVEISLSHFVNNGEAFAIAFVIDITLRKETERNINLQKEQLEKITIEVRKLNAELEAKVEERTLILKEALQRLEQSQEELSEALDKERQLNEIKSRFVSMASHEFRTPLSTMLSSANLLKKYTQTEEQDKRERHIDKITGSIHHLNLLLEDFLSLGKLDEGKLNIHVQPIILEETIQDSISELEGQLKEGQEIIFDHNGPTEMPCDKGLLKNILFNLLSNAIKFSDKEIRISAETEGNAVKVTVKDRGIGISEEDQGHLFSSFFRAKNAFNIQGTGLGLHIVKRYLEMLGGQIELKSTLGKGTTITFTLPIKS